MTAASSADDVAEYLRKRNWLLKRENEHLRAERIRLERLLALTLEVAVAGTGIRPEAFLDAAGALVGTDLAKPAYVELRERMTAAARRETVLRVLEETAP